MGILTDRVKQAGQQSSTPSEDGTGVGQIGEREQAIIDRHNKKAEGRGSLLAKIARGTANKEIGVRKQQRDYVEKAKTTDATTVDLTNEMLKNLNNRSMVLDTYRQMSPAQRQEVLKLAPGIAQQIGDDRGGIPMRAFNAVTGGISDVAQPVMELAGQVTGTDWGGTPEEIEFIRQLEGSASQEFAPARPGDPWYQKGPLQALQMTPWMATTIGGGIGGGAAAKAGGQVLARGASAGVPGAKAVFQGVGAVGKIPKIVGLKGATTKATMEGLGTVAGITAAGFPSQYAQEVDSLKELGMEDNLTMRLLAGGTAAVASALESVIPNPLKAGPVPLTQGAVKAARQYLWNAAKQAPGEMSEEYLQGVTSGLGQWVAQYLDENAEDKSIADAFQTGYEQAKEAALPMAFLLGVPAVGGAANAARLARLQAIRNKGFVSTEDAQKEGIEGKNRKERLANADAAIKQLEQEAAAAPTPTDGSQAKPWYDFGSGEPEGDIPPPPGLGLLDRLTGRAPQGTPPRLPGAPGATGATGAAKPEPSGQPTRLPGSSSAAQNPELPAPTGTQPASQQPVEAESQADSPQQEVDSFAEYADAWSEQSAKRRGVEKKPLTQSMLDTLRTTIDNHADAAIQNGRSSKFATDNTAFDEREMREIQNAVRRKGYEVGEVQRSSEGGVDYIGFDVTGKRTGQPPSQASENTAPAPQQPKGGGSTTTAGQVPPITSQSPSTSGLSEGTGTKPATGSPSVSPDAPAKPETSKGKAAGEDQSSEARADDAGSLRKMEPTEEGRPADGKPVMPGDRFLTNTGRETTPYPKYDNSTNRKSINSEKKAQLWLMENAIAEAESRGDDFNLTTFRSELEDARKGKLPQASKNSATLYVFGDYVPKVPKPFLKDPSQKPPSRATAPSKPEPRKPEPIQTIAGKMTYDEFESKGYAPEQVTKEDWVNLQRSLRRSLGQSEESGPVAAPYSDYEEFHKDTVRKALKASEEVDPQVLEDYPDLKWHSETRAKLEAVPALKGAKVEPDEKTATVKVTRPDGLSTTIHFNADEELAKAAKAKLRNPKSVYGRYVRAPGAKTGDIYIRSDANHTNILNHEVMHWLEDQGVVTKEEVEQYGGREAIADKYGKWAAAKQRKKDSVFQRIYDALEPVFSSQARFFEEVGTRKASKPAKPDRPTDWSTSGQSKPIPGMESEEATYTVHSRKPDVIPDTFSVVVAGKPTGKGWTTVKGTGMSAEEAYDRAVRMFTDKRAKPQEKFSKDKKPSDSVSTIVDKNEVSDADFDAEMEKLMAGLAEPESGLAKPPAPKKAKSPRKPRSTKKQPAKTAEEKSAEDRARAAAKKEEAKRKMREAFEGTQGRPLSGFDPEIGIKVAQAVKLYIEAEALDFRAFIRELVSDFGRVWVEDKAPYFESAWRTANKLKWVDSPVGKVADVLTEIGDYGTLVSPNRVELGKHFQQQLESGKAYKSIVEARKEAATLIAGEDANIEPGTPAAKAIDEAVEQGVVRAARSIAESSADPLEVYDSLLDLYNRHPRLNVRTGTSMREQAYSTPAPVAWIANILSDTSRENTAYDSSAGNGMLLLGVDPENAIANELNPERAQSLRELGYDVHEGDATDYTPEQQPERIIINPPFGQLEGKTWTIDGTTTDKIDHAIVLKTLKSLPEDGKAVLIIGSKGFEKRQAKDELRRGEAYKNDKNFYNALYDGYNVTDHFTLHGDMYSKQGAAFPIDVIVIDGRGKSTLPKPYQIDHQNAIPRVINNYQELRDVGSRYLDTGTGRPSYLSTEPVADDMGGLSSLLEGQGKGDVKKGGRPSEDAGVGGSISPRGVSQSQESGGDSGQPSIPGSPNKQGTGKPKRLSSDDKSGASTGPNQRDDAGGLDRVADVDDQETGFQTAYKQRSGSRNVGTLVPTTHVRAVQDALDKAEDRYGNLDEFVAGELGYSIPELEKYFSAEQVDALALTIARHKEGKAFVLGDQCVSGDTLILDPTTGRQQKIRDLADANEEITVLSLTDQGLAPARASAPFFKGVSPLYRVTLDDGKEIDVTPHHRFLTQSGWSCLSDGIQIGDALAVAHESRANSQTTHASCEQTGFQTPQDCLGHYSTYHRLRGEQPLLERDSDQGRTPQQVYVDAHIRSLQREDGQASKRECNQVVPASTLHSKSNWMSLESHDLGVTLAQPLSCDVRLQRQNIGNVQQSDQSSCLLTQELPEVHPLERYADDRGLMVVSEYLPSTDGIEQTILHNHVSLQSQDQTNQTCSLEQSPQLTVAVWASVVSIEYQGVDDFYDMHVPVHCNYVGGGFVNHNTGVGKGRVAAATMVYAKRQGLVPVFVTQSSDLYSDMYRDLQDIGQHSEDEPFYALATNTLMGKDKLELPDGTTMQQSSDFSRNTFNDVAASVVMGDGPVAMIVIEKTTDAEGRPLGKTPKGKQRVRKVKEQREYDAVFTAYSQMQTVAGETKDRHAAMSLIAPNAFFVLDESHNAGGVNDGGGAHGDEGPVGRAARLRSLVSDAQGVLFLSATYAKNPGVMDLYAKTGMGDAIQGSDEALIETIIKGGLPLQQVLSEMLVESGTYMRREKSFKGIGFSAKVVQTGEAEADEVAGIFNAINELDGIKNEIIKSKAFKRWLTAQGLGIGKDSATGKRGMDSSTFSSIVHNLVDQMLLSIKADAVADEAIATLRRGESPVIGLSNTAGAALGNYLENFPAEVGEDIEFGFNTIASRYLERSREIMLTDVDATGKKTSRRVRLPDEVLGEDGVAAYNAAKALIEGFAADIPASPIDHIRNRIEEAGYKVAEITGRSMMVDYSEGKMRLARRPSEEQGKSGKLASVRKYNSGEIDVLILNQSGSTGLSAHASDKFINQKRRHMIIAQADRNIDTFMQMLGRINRTGQVEQHKGKEKGSNLPHYTLLMTNVPAEIRPSSVLMKKLASLNANVTADSKGSVSFDAPDILNKVGDRVVAEYIADNPALNHALGDIVDVNADGAPRVVPDIARKVSGRMAMRPIPEQKAFWDSVTETYAEEIEQLNKLGKNPLAATKMDLGARVLERVEIFAGDTTADSPFLQPAYADRVRVKKQGEPMTPDEIKSTIAEFYGSEPDQRTIREWSTKQGEIATEAIEAKAEQQVARLVNDEAIGRVRSRASAIQSTIRRRLNSVAPGMAVEVSEVQEEGRYSDAVSGIVIDVKAKKGKEHLPSGWIATIALSSPDRVVRVPFSRIETAGNSQPGDVYVAPSFEIASDRMYESWEEAGDVYEERIIGTGNVLAAFDQLVSDASRGNIVFFTDEQGVSQRGVLMPRSFNLDRWAEKRPATFATPQQVLDFISIDPGHQANDPNFAIQFTLDGTTMTVRSPRSRQRSGRYTTNQELIEASGTDFASVGQILQMKVRGKKQQLAVIEAAQKLGPLIAADYKEDARAIIGVPGTARKKAPAGDGGSSLDAFTSPELQDRQSMGAAKMRIASASDLVGDDVEGSGSKYASPDEEFERRWQMATKGIGKKTLATKLREFWKELVKSTTRGSLPELPRTEQFGEARSAMHAYQNAPTYAQLATADLLKKTSKPLSASDYDLFTRVVIMRDQAEAADKGERLSYGLTPEKARAELDRVEALAEANDRVQASLEYRKQWTEAMVDDFLSAHEYLGLDMSDRFKRENYFRHQVLYYMEAQQRGLGKKKVELTPNRGWLKGRTSGDDLGEAFDINANYLQAEWEVSTQMIADTKRAQAIGRLKRHYDKMRQLKEKAKYNNYVAVVGGLENMQEIEELRGLMAELRESGSLDSGEKAQLKEWSERIWELDPTMPFRQQMAIAADQIEGGAKGLGEDVPADFLRYVAALAKQDDSPLQGPALSFLKAVSDRKAFIKNALGDQYQTWENVVPDDHEEVAIRPGRAMFQAYSVPEQVASELMANLSKTLGISAEDLRPLTALGSKYTPLVVPQEVAAQMAAIDNKMDFGWLDRAWTRPMNAWKRWVLMSPTRVFKYNLRNLSEVDKVMTLNPAALKDIPQAIRDLRKLYSGADDIPATVRDWVERGGSGTLVRVNELGELNELKQFARLISDKRSGVVGKVIKAPANAWKTYWSAAGIGSDFRESILRYAAYLNYVKQLDAGKLTNYGGSVRAEVDGIKDNKDKAMRLSADLLGDYGDISLVGQFLRSRFAPFWSFQETNLRTYFRGLVNLASNEQSAIKAGMQIARAAGVGGLAKAPFLAYKLGRIAILFYGFKAMTTAFNQLLFSDDDDELPMEEKRKAHLTFGKNSKGEVLYFSRVGTAADVLDWVGLDSVDYDLRDVLDGRRTLKEVLNDMARSPVDKAYGMLSPFIKVPTELAVGQTAYPSVGKPRPIRDSGRYIAQNFGLQKEYDKLTGRPSTPYSITDLFLYKVEPGTSAYYLTLDAKFRWLKTARNRGVGYSDSVRGNALRNYKMAVRLKDQTAADKYLAEYEAAGGTKEGLLDSLEWSHPAGGLSTIDAYLFYKSLAPVEQLEYREAERFYYSELLTEDQANEIRARRDKRLVDLAFGKNKDESPKGKPEKQRDETFATYRERLRKWQEERKTAQEAIKSFANASE